MIKDTTSIMMECDKCQVATTCPRNGSSPLSTSDGRREFCHLIGGYGRDPVDESILSDDSRDRMRRDGPCLTVAEVPTVRDDMVEVEVVTIFSHAVRHDRESTNVQLDKNDFRAHSVGPREPRT